MIKLKGHLINPGKAHGTALISRTPISFYGGVDYKTGIVTEIGHELEGQCVKDKILIFPQAKGSTVGSYIIYGLKMTGNAPAAIINLRTEPIVATGVIIAGLPCVDKIDIDQIPDSADVEVDGDSVIVR